MLDGGGGTESALVFGGTGKALHAAEWLYAALLGASRRKISLMLCALSRAMGGQQPYRIAYFFIGVPTNIMSPWLPLPCV